MENNQDKTVVVEREPAVQETRPSSSGPIVAIIAIVVLVVLAVLAYNMFAGNNTTNDGTGTTNDTSIDVNMPSPTPTTGGSDAGTGTE